MTQHFNRSTETTKRRRLRATATSAEQVLWQALRNGQVGVKFRRQYSVDCYVVDFYAPSCKLAIEVDGAAHGTQDGREYDRERTRHLEAFGIEVLRFPNAAVTDNVDTVRDAIRRAIARRQANSDSRPRRSNAGTTPPSGPLSFPRRGSG